MGLPNVLRALRPEVVLWIMLWGGLNASPVQLGEAVRVIDVVHGLRAFLPLLAGALALGYQIRRRVWPWPLRSPLGLMTMYGLVGAVASLAFSPQPMISLYWCGVYLSVLAVLGRWLSGPESLPQVARLVRLNWMVVAGIGVVVSAVAVRAALSRGADSFYNISALVPSLGAMPMSRATGIARYAAVIGIVCLAQALAGAGGVRRWLWSAGGAVCTWVLWLAHSAGANLAFLGGVGLVLLLRVRPRVILGLLFLGSVVAATQPNLIVSRLLRDKTTATLLSGREEIWVSGIELVRDSPIFGLGFHADRLLLPWPFLNHISNAFLHATVQAGIAGSALFAIAWLWGWALLLRLRRERNGRYPAEARVLTVELGGVLAFLTVRALFESSGAFFGVDWLILAPVLAGFQTLASERRPQPEGNPASALLRRMRPEVPHSRAAGGLRWPHMWVLGTRVHMVTMEAVLRSIGEWIAEWRIPHYIVATGVHGIIEGHRDPAFKTILNRADLFIPDGFSLVWIARWRGISLRERVCGTDLLLNSCRLAAENGYRMFFYGDTEEVLAQLRRRLEERYPGLQIVGTYSPPFRPLSATEDEHVVRMINTAAPDVLWVGLGLPKQERWIIEHKDRLHVPVLVASGAAFKFASGMVRRAPRWVGEHGMEWLWRFVHEPKRLWQRVVVDVPVFVWLVSWELAVERLRELRTASQNAAKRTLDVVLATTGLIVSAPLWGLIAWLVKLGDGGPIFYVQERVGQGGRRFRSLKFRTMIPDAERRYGFRQATEDDPRITRVGRLLRRTALDELPQLWNIAKGEMSFVGPRALAPGEIEVNGDGTYVPLEAVAGFEKRHRVRPGLTGVAQIYAPRDVSRQQKFRYDELYIRKRSVWLDLRLIALSFAISLRGTWESRTQKW